MKLIRLLLAISPLIFLFSCNSSSEKGKGKSDVVVKDTSALGKLLDHFDSVKLPVLIPDDLKANSKELDGKTIEAMTGGKTFLNAFLVKDVPDLAKNASVSKYYAAGFFASKKNPYYGLIIRKKDQGEYYFFCTVNKKGEFISGICIAFKEGDDVNILTRYASIEENSILVSQSDVSGPKDPTSKNSFFEIGPDGTILAIKGGI